MNNLQQTDKAYWSLLPLAGIGLFWALYIVATLYYPGGSHDDVTAKGFSWLHNYWCNLLDEKALNGLPNTARPVAFAAMGILVVSLVLFWAVFPVQAGLSKKVRLSMQVSGLLAMLTSLALSTRFHDSVINIASLFGLVALGGTFAGLRKLGWNGLFRLGLFNLVLIGLNNLCYYGPHLFQYLAVVQKITFLYFLVWIGAICWQLYKRQALQEKV